MSTNDSTVVHTEFGAYRPLSVRLPDFLKDYPPSDGFGIQVEVMDSLSIRPGLLELYKTCIAEGRNPREVGLPPFPSTDSVFFVAKLVRDGVVLATASTHQVVQYQKDYEIAETRARQRLVAALGHDGGLLDEDENLMPTGRGPLINPDQSEPEDDLFGDQSSDSVDGGEDGQTNVTVPNPPKTQTDMTPQLQAQVKARTAQLDAHGTDYTIPTNKSDALEFLRTTAPTAVGG